MTSISDLIQRIQSANDLIENPHIPPHSSNLLHQLGKSDATTKLHLYTEIVGAYLRFREAASHLSEDLSTFVESLTDALNSYMDVLKDMNISHQADFKSSVIPEMFFLLLYKIVKSTEEDFLVSSQTDIPIECMFDVHGSSRMMFKTKKLDMLVYRNSTLSLDNSPVQFPIPLIAMEMKTNLDKNMMSGIEHSVASLKKTFPNSLYYVITEYSDMAVDKLNYASSGIDEIYILRQQKRAKARNDINCRNPISRSLVLEISQHCVEHMQLLTQSMPATDVRMLTGKLIH